MKKSKWLITVVIISFISLILINYNSRDKKEITFNDCVVSSENYNNIKKERTQSEIISNIQIDGYDLFEDKDSEVFYCSLCEEQQEKLNPKINYNDSYDLVIDKSLTKESIKNNETFKILIYNSKDYKELSIKFTTLPLLNIVKEDGEISDVKSQCQISIFDNRYGVVNRESDYIGKIKLRGASTLAYPKKGFSFSINNLGTKGGVKATSFNTNILGLRNGTDYILYAGYNDQEKVRNVFSSNLWYESCSTNNQLGVTNGMFYKYVELFIDNKYWGLYAIGFPIDEQQLEIDVNNSQENIYKKVSWYSEKLIDLNNEKYNVPFYGYEIKTSNENWKPLYNYYNSLFNEENYNDIVDVGNSIDFYLFNSLIINDDGPHDESLKNAYLITKNSDDNTLVLFCPWDMDITWGNHWFDNGQENYTRKEYYSYSIDFPFYNGAIEMLIDSGDREIKDLIKTRYMYLRKSDWSNETIIKMIDNLEDDIFNSGAYIRDREKWPDGTYQDQNNYLSNFKEFVLKRFEYFDKVIFNL